jgi:predicted P-loop ATPase
MSGAQSPAAGTDHLEAAGQKLRDTAKHRLTRVERTSFPDQPNSPSASLPATLENFRHLLKATRVLVRFNKVTKRADIDMPDLMIGRQNRDAVVLSHLESLLVRNGMASSLVRSYLLVVADESQYDPFGEWVDSKPWDEASRLADLCKTIEPAGDFSRKFLDILVRKWLLSIIAATFKENGFRARGVLVLQGPQGIGKTSWIAGLVPPADLCEEVVKLGHSWDGGSKDARLTALRHRIVELGELESSFRREMAGLKAFITETTDKIRPPYGRVDAEYPRSTIFAASVNDREFLQDPTGNSRFWTIPVEKIDFKHGIDMQQVFAELKVAFEQGEQWWLTSAEEKALAEINHRHRMIGTIEAKVRDALDVDLAGRPNLPKKTANEVLERLGFSRPTNPQSKEANATLRSLLGEPKRIRGQNRWPIPWREEGHSPSVDYDDPDIY